LFMQTGMTNEEFSIAVNHGMNNKLVKTIIVLYDHPKDFPESYVARAHIVGRGRHWPSPNIFIVRDTLEEVRAAIPARMHRMNRLSIDDPRIIELYL